MNKIQAQAMWNEVVLDIRSEKAKFVPWRTLRTTINDTNLREFVNNLLRGFSQGLVDFASYSPSEEAVVVSPRMKVPNAQFVFIFKNGNEYDYFGIKKDGSAIVETTKVAVKLGFAEVINSI